MIYFDPIYGKIELEGITEELLRKCSELKRLKYIGMMNFKSISMTALTNINRLEHSIGLSYLAQEFAKKNNVKDVNNLLVAALYHDINCTPFGHAIEWAIDRYTSYEHENITEWICNRGTIIKQIFLDPPGLHQYDFETKYKLNLNKIVDIIKGDGCFFINNSGIDLDNIDNVFRMGFYLGIYDGLKDTPLKLINNMRFDQTHSNFIANECGRSLIEEWYNLRSDIYRLFIYSKEYFSYEYLLFELVSEYSKHFEYEDLENLWIQTDETLLHYLIGRKSKSKKLSQLAKRILLFDLDFSYSIIETLQFEKKGILSSKGFQDGLIIRALAIYNSLPKVKKVEKHKIGLHLTTDDRKTSRRIDFYLDGDCKIEDTHIGEDRRSLLLGIVGSYDLSSVDEWRISECFINELRKEGICDATVVPFSNIGNIADKELNLF